VARFILLAISTYRKCAAAHLIYTHVSIEKLRAVHAKTHPAGLRRKTQEGDPAADTTDPAA